MTIPLGSLRPMPSAAMPAVSGALSGWSQTMVFDTVTKTIVGGEVVETMTPVIFQGVIQPLTDRQLILKPEGQRAWSWFQLHADSSLALGVDDIVVFAGKQTRVMSIKDYSAQGYLEYHICQDWTGAGP